MMHMCPLGLEGHLAENTFLYSIGDGSSKRLGDNEHVSGSLLATIAIAAFEYQRIPILLRCVKHHNTQVHKLVVAAYSM